MNLRVFYLTRRGLSDGYKYPFSGRNPPAESSVFCSAVKKLVFCFAKWDKTAIFTDYK